MIQETLLTIILQVFLIHNSHTNQFIYVKCTVQWFLAYAQICTTITTDTEVGRGGEKKEGERSGVKKES